jgi:hypothetical protein
MYRGYRKYRISAKKLDLLTPDCPDASGVETILLQAISQKVIAYTIKSSFFLFYFSEKRNKKKDQ